MDHPTNPAGLAALYEAAGIEPHVSTALAAAHIARLVAENRRLAAEVDKQTLLTGLSIGTAGERYIVTVQREGKLTPHQARRDAEAERDRIRDAVLEMAYQEDLSAKVCLAHIRELSHDLAHDKPALDQATAVNRALSETHSGQAKRLRQIAARA